jgi:hypothetical protein
MGEAAVKGPPPKGGGLVGSTAVVVPTSPTLTRLSYGDRGQIVEVATLVLGPRPTSGCFLSPDLSNLWVQTSSGSCPKRLGGVVPDSTIAEGRERGLSAPFRYARRKAGAAPLRGHCVGVGGHVLREQRVPSPSAFLCHLKVAVSSGGFL